MATIVIVISLLSPSSSFHTRKDMNIVGRVHVVHMWLLVWTTISRECL